LGELPADAHADALADFARGDGDGGAVSNRVVRVEPKPSCPECGGTMRLRRRKLDDEPFWGCSDFPLCRGVRDIDEDGLPIVDEIEEQGG
jgi:ssDNA-binding Zn-finger/Zn-ribbon topoisomerase 1